ncbi:AGAP008194-PA-like protein [Anopheles sinensis]|uniref:AGAP008194-PA-like protein n=1 Tax=Anopheles sinensis TaxID=74873 RepID=A0A084VL72_ANOSI|nr:AGAP008194-PA-like protein [Anopheles sinensis]
MSKRMGHFQLKQPLASKKPKLDIEIVPSQQYNPQPSTSNGNWKPKVSNNAAKMDALWGDEDDEFIVLASQAVEEMSQQSQAFSTSGVADMTFGKFSRNVQTSTQAIVCSSSTVSSKPPARATDKQVAELFADGEDDIFTEKFDDNYENIENKLDNYFDNEFDDDFNLDEFRQEGQKPLVSGRIEPPKPPEPEPVFKVPEVRSTSTTITAQSVSVVKTTSTVGAFTPKTPSVNTSMKLPATASGLDTSRADEQMAKENALKKQEHAKDIQVKFLTKRLEECDKKLETMQREHNEALERVKIKDGEVSTLRYRLKTVSETIENQRKEKLRETETIQKEWVEKQKELEKIIAAQTAELSFKEMELMNLRMKRLNNSKRAVEVRENQTEGPRAECVTEDSFVLCNVLSQLAVTEPLQEPLTLDPEVFSISIESVAQHGVANRKFYHCSRGDAIIAQQLVTLQTCLSQLVSRVGEGKASVQLPMTMLPVVAEAIMKGLAEISHYCQRLVPAQAKDNHVGRPVDAGQGRLPKGRMDLVRSMSVFQREELYPGEQERIARRFLAVVGLFCRISSDLVDETLLKERQIGALARDIKLVSNVSALHAHHGMVTGAAALLKGISFRLHRVTPGFTENGLQLIALFRSIVLCQNSAPSSMLELSEFLRRLSYRRADAVVLALLNQLCRSSHHRTDNSGRPKEKYRMKTISFSEETCTLQMYATLLQSSVREELPCEAWQFRLLLANLENTICFLRNALVPTPVEWVKNFIVGKSSRECNLCHIRMVSAFLVLLYRVLQCWHQRTVVEEKDPDKLYSIARKGTLLLYDLFGTAYCGKLLLLGGDAVKYRLRIIYDWLRKYQKTFQFHASHVKALDRLDLRLLMNDPLKSSHEPDENKVKTESTATGTSTVDNGRSEIVKQLFTGFFKNKHCLQR